jgi:hypothetical protein
MSPGQESIDPYKAPAASSIVAEGGHHSTLLAVPQIRQIMVSKSPSPS